MSLTEKEKEELKKKYREQRQAIWTGKHPSRLPTQDASEVEEIEVLSDEAAPDVSAENALPRHGDPSSAPKQTDVEQSKAEVERSEAQQVKIDSPLVQDRVQVQRENSWQEQSSTDEEKGLIMVTWKLALGVVGTIIVLVGIGILLGYWFAS